MTASTAIVTGAGRGVGLACVQKLRDEGWRVVATVRDIPAARAVLTEGPDLALVHMDLREPDAIPGAMAQAQAFLGHVDCMVNNAGHALMGAAEDTDFDAVRDMFQTNFFGAAEATSCVLPGMRERGSGTVVCVSSVGAHFSNPLLGFYHASKYAMTAWAEAIRVECGARGIRVHMIEPGMVDTDFPKATRVTGALAQGEGPYLELFTQLRAGFQAWRARTEATDAAVVADAVVAAATDPTTPFRVLVGEDAAEMAGARERLDDDAFHAWLAAFVGVDTKPFAP